MSDWVGHLVEAGATELAFCLHDPAMGAYDGLVDSGQFASRDSLARLAQDVVPRYQIGGTAAWDAPSIAVLTGRVAVDGVVGGAPRPGR